MTTNQTLLTTNIRLVEYICNKYSKDDLFFSHTCEILLKNIEKYDCDKGKFGKWLEVCIKSIYIDTVRKKSVFNNSVDIDLVNIKSSYYNNYAQRDLLINILKSIKGKYGAKRAYLFIRFVSGEPMNDLCVRYDYDLSKVKDTIYRIRVFVKENYGKQR